MRCCFRFESSKPDARLVTYLTPKTNGRNLIDKIELYSRKGGPLQRVSLQSKGSTKWCLYKSIHWILFTTVYFYKQRIWCHTSVKRTKFPLDSLWMQTGKGPIRVRIACFAEALGSLKSFHSAGTYWQRFVRFWIYPKPIGCRSGGAVREASRWARSAVVGRFWTTLNDETLTQNRNSGSSLRRSWTEDTAEECHSVARYRPFGRRTTGPDRFS